MKIFSIILTTLFFLSFVSIASAEVYTITNESDVRVQIVLDNLRERTFIEAKLLPDECLKYTEISPHPYTGVSPYPYSLRISVIPNPGDNSISLCNGQECINRNYEVYIQSRLFSNTNRYKVAFLEQANTSETCIDLREQPIKASRIGKE